MSAAASRSGPAGRWSASTAFAWRSVLKIKHVPEQLGDVIGIPILFTLMFTYLFGGAISGSTQEYLQFLLPGTEVMAVVLVTVYTGVTLNVDIASGTLDRFRSLPIWRPAPIVGSMIGDVGRYLVASALVIGIGLAIGFRPGGGAVGVLAAVGLVIVFALSLSWVWAAAALVLRTPSSVQTAGLLVLFPITFASNIFVDPATMPAWVRSLVQANPISHLVSATRGLMGGGAPVGDIVWVLGSAAVLIALFAPLTMALYRRKQ